MKLSNLLEEHDERSLLLRKVALTLQDDLQDDSMLGRIIEDIELHYGKPRVNLYDELITLHMTGPLFELYMDISYKGNEWTVDVRTDKDLPGDSGLVLATATKSCEHWFTAKRLVGFMLGKKPTDTDMYRYNFLWFDKIARNLDNGFELFLKNIRIDSDQIVTSQIIEKDGKQTVKRYELEFCKHPNGGCCYRLGLRGELRDRDQRDIEDFSDINEILHGDD